MWKYIASCNSSLDKVDEWPSLIERFLYKCQRSEAHIEWPWIWQFRWHNSVHKMYLSAYTKTKSRTANDPFSYRKQMESNNVALQSEPIEREGELGDRPSSPLGNHCGHQRQVFLGWRWTRQGSCKGRLEKKDTTKSVHRIRLENYLCQK